MNEHERDRISSRVSPGWLLVGALALVLNVGGIVFFAWPAGADTHTAARGIVEALQF
jgi:hypothetical protein